MGIASGRRERGRGISLNTVPGEGAKRNLFDYSYGNIMYVYLLPSITPTPPPPLDLILKPLLNLTFRLKNISPHKSI